MKLLFSEPQYVFKPKLTDQFRAYVEDCRKFLRRYHNDVDAIVTDPPYEMQFMNKKWDGTGISFNIAVWEAAYRALKPGGYLLSFGGTRTYHRMACAIEDADFEIRDCLQWLYGSGFPKSQNISKAIDAHFGAERAITKQGERKVGLPGVMDTKDSSLRERRDLPVLPEAAQWDGWGTALKPAYEPIVLARKPFDTTTAENVLTYGTGGLNIDGCRIGCDSTIRPNNAAVAEYGSVRCGASSFDKAGAHGSDCGRWPANVCLDPDAAALLDEQSGELHTQDPATRASRSSVKGVTAFGTGRSVEYADSGGASRFFYCAKASRRERDLGCESLLHKSAGRVTGGRKEGSAGLKDARAGAGRTSGGFNHHPTVKPIALLRWLVKLVTPSNGLILDPFMGSGTTGIAAILEGFDFAGSDNDPEAVEIATARMRYWQEKHTKSAKLI